MTSRLFEFDKNYGCTVAGMDEAGRGPLAGPVVCACCIMPLDDMIEGINDSKKVSEKNRERLYELITKRAITYGVGIISNEEIDRINILNATKAGMNEAFFAMKTSPDILLTDAVSLSLPIKNEAIIKGDAKSYNIAAASIIAKVTRDRIMREYDKKYGGYGFAANKGYGTAEHIAALKSKGATPIHRCSFIKNFLSKELFEQK